MSKIRMKIIDCEKESNSLIVAFASENCKKPIEEWNHLAYQPTLFDNPEDAEKVLRQIAKSGIVIIQDQEKSEEFVENDVLEKNYSHYVGQELVYDINDLLSEDMVEEQQIIISEGESEVDKIIDAILSADKDS